MSSNAAPYSTLIHQAFDFAARAHQSQFRKNREERIPYFSHAARVAGLLEQAGFDEEVVAAGALHDTLEDTGVSRDDLARAFGARVAELVDHVTEQDKSLPWDERKKRYLERLEDAPVEALAVSCADKIHNIWSLIVTHRSGGEVWAVLKQDRAAQLERLSKLKALFRERFDHPLRDQFEEALETLEKEC